MNTILTTPDVKLFVTAVREHLHDLTEEEREELTGGLEGDLSDLVEERGVEALPEPADYARELRAAAGFTPEAVMTRRPGALPARTERALDSAHERWERFAGGLPGNPWELVVALRPAWWLLRAWVAVQLVDLVWGSGGYNYGLSPVPSLMGWGLPALAVAVLGSVLIGSGRLWPGPGRGRLGGRLLLLSLNLLAIAATPLTLDSVYTPEKASAWYGDDSTGMVQPTDGLSFNGEAVANVYPYDAQGHLLIGVQLVDRQGRRLSVTEEPYGEEGGWGEFVHQPWQSGRTRLYNVFPLPEQTLDPDTQDPVGDPRLQAPPFASLPPVSVAGVRPSVLSSPADSPRSTVR
jgi:hypothetical protein